MTTTYDSDNSRNAVGIKSFSDVLAQLVFPRKVGAYKIIFLLIASGIKSKKCLYALLINFLSYKRSVRLIPDETILSAERPVASWYAHTTSGQLTVINVL